MRFIIMGVHSAIELTQPDILFRRTVHIKKALTDAKAI